MANLIWFICINAGLGLILLFPLYALFLLIEYKRYGRDIVDEAIDSVVKELDDCFNAMNNPERSKYLSITLGIFLWEFTLPYGFITYHSAIKELYNLKNRP
jgi:hypothetical protein